ncbi:MAG: thioesterase family protein [Clostridia bacterium]|nr:thioesterase family protein [Clostridia bacterium]
MLSKGIKHTLREIVNVGNTAKEIGSGSLNVYGTPAMILLIEKTAVALLENKLEDGQTTVGTKLNIDHVAPSPVSMMVECQLELVAIDGKKLVFEVEIKDEKGLVGQGTHERFIVDEAAFQRKADSRI